MLTTKNKQKSSSGPAQRQTGSGSRRPNPLVRLLISPRLALICFSILCVVTLVATFVMPGRSAEFYVERLGPLLGSIVVALGLDKAFLSPWFLGPTGLLVTGGLVVATRRLRARGVTVLAWSALHASMLIIVIGGVVTAIWAEEGLVRLNVGGEAQTEYVLRGGAAKPMGFSVALESLRTELYGSETRELEVRLPELRIAEVFPILGDDDHVLASTGHRFRVMRETNEFASEPSIPLEVRQDLPVKGPALLLKIDFPDGRVEDRWLFSESSNYNVNRRADPSLLTSYKRTPDVKNHVGVLRLGPNRETMTIRVNQPVEYAGKTIYVSKYDDTGNRFAVFQVRSDPGVLVVYAGFLALILSMIAVHGAHLRQESSSRREA